MERMLVVVFENELKAYDGSRALTQLDSEGSISIHAKAVIKKNADGTVTLEQKGEDFPIKTVGGTAIGAFIGLLGGPIGVAIGAVAGTFVGGAWDMNRSGVNAEFLDDVSAKLTPGKWAVVSQVSEEWVTPVDSQMAALGGTVFRTTLEDVENDQYKREVASIKADIAQLKAEQAKSRTEHKAKLQSKIDVLDKKLHAKLEAARLRSEEQKKETTAKVEALEKKAAKAKGEAKTKMEKRVADIKEREQKTLEEFDEWFNGDELN